MKNLHKIRVSLDWRAFARKQGKITDRRGACLFAECRMSNADVLSLWCGTSTNRIECCMTTWGLSKCPKARRRWPCGMQDRDRASEPTGGSRRSSSAQAWPLGIVPPARNQILHGHGVVSGADRDLLVQLVSRHDPLHVGFDAKTWLVRHSNLAADDLQGLAREALLAFLPDPVGVDGGDVARCGRCGMGEHGQGNVKMIVRMRAPGQAELLAHLRQAHRALHRPEMRIGQGNVDRIQAQ